MEQLNIVGKRSGEGFVAHKAMLVNALSRTLADRVMLMDLTIGRKGLLGYLKALGGSNIIKVIPSNGSASVSQATNKRLKVICGANTSYLADMEWIGKTTPFTLCDVRVSPSNSVKPNMGANELAEALARVLPFTNKEKDKGNYTQPVLACVNFVAKADELTLVSADGFRLAVVTLDYDGEEGEALVNRDDLKGVASALKRAKRARVSFEQGGEKLTSKSLIMDTELIRYRWTSYDGNYPDYEKLIPTEFNTFASFDTVEAIKAVNSLNAISDSEVYAIDLTIGNGKIVMANPDDKGQAELVADTDGEGFVRINGQYLAQVLRACGGMVEFKLLNASSPMLFTNDGYKVVVMPMMTDKAQEQQKAEAKSKAEQPTEQAEPMSWADAEKRAKLRSQEQAEQAVAEKPKARRSRAKEPVAV